MSSENKHRKILLALLIIVIIGIMVLFGISVSKVIDKEYGWIAGIVISAIFFGYLGWKAAGP